MLTRLSVNNIKKGGREKSANAGLNAGAESREPEVYNFVILKKRSQKFILQEFSHVRKRQNGIFFFNCTMNTLLHKYRTQ